MAGPTKPDWDILVELLARHRRDALENPPLSPLAKALMDVGKSPLTNPFLTPNPTAPQSLASALSGLFGPLSAPPPRGGMFGNPFLSPIGSSVSSPSVAAAPKPKQRSTFYSFHYDDVFRVNHIRNAGAILPTDKQRLLTPQDRSLWEKAKNTNPAALKMIIARGLAGTTVTTVLAGEYTWERPWVRYEIARSLLKGNGLLTVYIDGCECPRNGLGRRGPNPLDFIALGLNRRIYEQNNRGGWVPYDQLTTQVPVWPKWLPRPSPRHVMPLGWAAPAYDWIEEDGRKNLVHWTHDAAKAAGR